MKTEIIVITDRSGSMGSIKKDADGGFDSFIADQKLVPGEARVTMVMFDDKVETEYQAKPLDQVPPLNLKPRGSTSLLDAIGTAMSVQGERIKAEGWADMVIVTIITDGGENSSREYSRERIKGMITHAEAHGWKFVFLAANQDAFSVGASMGISGATTMNFAATAAGTAEAYASTSAMVRSLRSGTPL